MVQIEVYTTSNKKLGDISATDSTKVKDIKREIAKLKPALYPDRQSIRSDIKGKDVKDESTIENLTTTKKVFVKDLGPQIGWKTVFLLEYAGPLFLYIFVSFRPWILYGELSNNKELSFTANIAASLAYTKIKFKAEANVTITDDKVKYMSNITVGLWYMAALWFWSIHYAKRIYETQFVHRFSHGTMPVRNLFKNCGYYWGFCVYVAYHTNHPLFTPPPAWMQILGGVLFIFCELGNLSIHILLRDLRPPGTTTRKIPVPNDNPLTTLFNFVSCPNYTYEVGSWFGFTLLTSCIPAGLFALAGFYQMAIWALGKHKNYKKEFPNYPKSRKAILPFVL